MSLAHLFLNLDLSPENLYNICQRTLKGDIKSG